MAVVRVTDWPTKFPQPMRGFQDQLATDDILRSSRDELAQQGTNPLRQPKVLQVQWQFVDNKFYYFEGWYVHYIWRGARGFRITIEGITYIAFMNKGYQAEAGDSFASWQVSAELEVTEI